jgi:hypothetical protein
VTVDNRVLVTGAGVSRLLGSSEKPMPLMPDWSDRIVKALDHELVGIRPNQSGPEFEKAVGDFLTWQRILPLSSRYLPMGMREGDRWIDDVPKWTHQAKSRADKVVRVLHRTLYEEFGMGRVNPELAKQAYRSLVSQLPFTTPDRSLISA